MKRDVELVAINHWDTAVETHSTNLPEATHYNAKVQQVEPRSVVDSDSVKLLTAGPQCTHFSSARGGKPVDEQKRASPWHVLDWVAKLLPENILIENVRELKSWGPVLDGEPTRNGEFFEAWTNTLEGLGYSVGWRVLNAADYGEATSRERLFIIARRNNLPTWPDPTHSENGEVPGTDPWRPAAEIIDWSDPGESIWERSRPLVNGTMERIAEGIRRFAPSELDPYVDVLADLTKYDVKAMQHRAVSIENAPEAAQTRDTPFLVRGKGKTPPQSPDDVTRLCLPFILGQHSNSQPRDATEEPLPTIATRGAIQLLQPETIQLPTPEPSPENQISPYLVTYNGESGAEDISKPLPTVTTRDRFALVIPQHYPWGLDINYRMLKPSELAAAMGFPEEYEFAGTMTDAKEQIGNAVPVSLARHLCGCLLADSDPTLNSYTSSEASIPSDS